MAYDLGQKYADYLGSIRDYHGRGSANVPMNGYGVINGVDSLSSMDSDSYEFALQVFSCVDKDTQLGKNFSVARYPALLCAAFLVNGCPQLKTSKIKASNIAFLAQYLYLFDKEQFEVNLACLGNNNLLDTIISELPSRWSYDYACSTVVKNAKEIGTDLNDKQALAEFWVMSTENVKNNPEQYTFTNEARRSLVSHVTALSREGVGRK